jgi:acetylornithine deacetylase/succinyl-diaminopimelate desuccinylase-like protein
MTDRLRLRAEAVDLLRLLVACDTSNPPGREAQAAAVVEDYLGRAGVACERVAKDPDRPNLVARLRGRGDGPSLAFLGHLDVVRARREDWSVEPFAAIERDGAVWGRGTIDMKCQVAATAVALATLAREGFEPASDLMLILTADEEVGDAQVGAPFLVEERPDLRPDFVVGEGAGERIPTPDGPIYLLDHGVKATVPVELTVRGTPGDASLPDVGQSAIGEMTRLLGLLSEDRPPRRVPPELEPLLDAVAPGDLPPAARVERARSVHPALDQLVGALAGTVVRPTVVDVPAPENVVPDRAVVTLQCLVAPGTTRAEVEQELRHALGPGRYGLDVGEPLGGSTSPIGTVLHEAISTFLADSDPDARLIPALGYGLSDCHFMREAYGSVAYGFIPFRHADPLTNLRTKHGVDERILVGDLLFQVDCALSVPRTLAAASATRASSESGR